MSEHKLKTALLGSASLHLAESFFSDDKATLLKSGFFQPYNSLTEVLFKMVSIVTAPVLSLSVAISSTILGSAALLKSIVNLFSEVENQTAKKQFEKAKDHLIITLAAFLFLSFSSLVNLVGFIGCGIASIVNFNEEEQGGSSYVILNP